MSMLIVRPGYIRPTTNARRQVQSSEGLPPHPMLDEEVARTDRQHAHLTAKGEAFSLAKSSPRP
jgi:hypothetical protein